MAQLEIRAFLEDGEELIPFTLRISEPLLDVEGGDYYCTLNAPKLFEREKKIYGADENQAKMLSIQFIKKLLGKKRMTNEDHNPIDLGWPPSS